MKLGVGARPWAGLDIGTYSVKLVTLQPGGTKGRYAEAPIPPALPGAAPRAAGPPTPPALGGGEPPGPAILAGLIDDCMTRVDQSPRGFAGISIGVSGPDV